MRSAPIVIAEPFRHSDGIHCGVSESGCVGPFVERRWEVALGNADDARLIVPPVFVREKLIRDRQIGSTMAKT